MRQVIIDGGANLGEYSIACSEMEDVQMYAFESSAPTFLMLNNEIKHTDIKCIRTFQYALSDSQKNLILKYDFEGSGITSVGDAILDIVVFFKKEEVVKRD